jgi:hypothetical protein
MVHEKLAEAENERREMAHDVKKLVAVMNHGRGMVKALMWMGAVGSAFAGAAAWFMDHWHAFVK